MKPKATSKFSDETREQIRANALARGAERHEEVVEKVTKAMRAIEGEINAHQGLYPANGGRLDLAELVRRSDIGAKTLFGERYKETFKKNVVDPWLLSTSAAGAASRREAKRSAAQRVAEWRELYDDLLTAYRISELDWHEARRLRAKAEEELQKLKDENKELRKKLNKFIKGNVTKFPSA